ncbi:chromate transporter [Amycolatopsis vastitatis]|uniref:chromate transporter n=1 Tax=Amycolatopsis vastitatis TaxID=1905142 RepID=UPI00196AF3CE|nr:chromate transporter [Amycolatopsis vastitatis]
MTATHTGEAVCLLLNGALSYGGGFVIIPLMQHHAVHTYGWMTDAQFLDAVVLGQITPGPIVQTVAVVGHAAAGLTGALLAALVVFAPSFAFVLIGGPHLGRLRGNQRVRSGDSAGRRRNPGRAADGDRLGLTACLGTAPGVRGPKAFATLAGSLPSGPDQYGEVQALTQWRSFQS